MGDKIMGFNKSQIQDILPLSPMQEGILYNFIANSKSQAYFEQISFDIYGMFDLKIFEKSFQSIIKRYEALRTIYNYKSVEKPIQIVLKDKDGKVDYFDITQLDANSQKKWIEKYKKSQIIIGFDLTKDLLIRLAVIQLEKEKYEIIFNFHHIIMDGWCIGIVVKDLFQIYNDLINSTEPSLSEVVPYSNYIKWLERQDKSSAGNYWEKYLEDYEQNVLVPKLNQKASMEYIYREFCFEFKASIIDELTALARKNNVTVNVIFQALWAVLLMKYNGSDDVVFGTVVSGRPYKLADVDKIVGLFINTIPVRIKNIDQAFTELLKNMQLRALDSEKYDFYPLAEIQSKTKCKQGLVNHIMIFENYPIEEELGGGENNSLFGVKIDNVQIFEQTNYDFNIIIMPGSKFTVKISYNGLVYDDTTIKSIESHIRQAIDSVLKENDVQIKNINILSLQEEEYLLKELNDTKLEYRKDATLHQLFEEQAGKMQDRVAIICKDVVLTYKELNEKANQLAQELVNYNIRNGSIVAIVMERSVDILVSILAILKAGGTYLPIDTEYPSERIEYMLKDSQAEFLLIHSEDELIKNSDSSQYKIIDVSQCLVVDRVFCERENHTTPDSTAYVIYTSGSTGNPKGVKISHRNVINFIYGVLNKIEFEEIDSVLCLTTISFDIFVLEAILPLIIGKKVIMADKNQQVNMNALEKLLRKYPADVIQATPSRMKLVAENVHSDILQNFQRILIGGDSFPKDLLQLLKTVCTGRIFNMYGPTETTVWSTVKEVTSEELNIGKPIGNTQVYILNKEQTLLPVGVLGDLYIGGDGVAPGYYNRPELTEERFVHNHYLRNDVIYCTGDVARWLPSGELEFAGRADFQVKLRGYRIELEEIELNILKYCNIKETVVVVKEDKCGIKYLCGYIVSGKKVVVKDLRDYLSKKIPEYMIPDIFVQIDEIPFTSNGKINRRALPAPETKKVLIQDYEAPQTELEFELEKIWCKILGINKISIESEFFSLGGHSIAILKIISSISRKIGTDIGVQEFIEYNSIKKLGKYIEEKAKEKNRTVYPLIKASEEQLYKPFPLTGVQMAYLAGRNSGYEMGGISTHIYFEIETEMDIHRLNMAINKVIARHPMLRTIILPSGMQKVLEEIPVYQILSKDLFDRNEEEKEECIQIEREKMSHHIFQTDKWPLFEIKSFEIDNTRKYLCIGVDMLIADAGSMKIICNEITKYYSDMNCMFPSLNVTFQDYVYSLEEFKKSEKYLEDKRYFDEKCNDFPNAPALPLKAEPSKIMKPVFHRTMKRIKKSTWENLKQAAYKNNVTPSSLLLTVYARILGYWSNQQRLALNLTLFNRVPFHEDVMHIIGDFTSVILMDIDLKKGSTFWEQVIHIQKGLLQALEHRHYDGIDFIRDISKLQNLGQKAAMPIVFTSMLFDDIEDNHEINRELKYSTSQTSQVYIDHQVTENNGDLILIWDYVSQLFDATLIDSIVDQYLETLNNLDLNISIELHLPFDMKQSLEIYNDTQETFKMNTLTELFINQVKRVPNNTAVQLKDVSFTYLELDIISNCIAIYLYEKGVKKGDYVAVSAKRSPYTVANILGILKVGAAYVPIDPEYPSERQKYITKNCSCKFFMESDIYITEKLCRYKDKSLKYCGELEDTAYVIYTSGSTGNPKGVAITHKAVVNTIISINQMFQINENDKLIGLSSFCFDLSVYDVFGALTKGATLVMVEDQRNSMGLIETIKNYGITVWNSVPAIMEMLVESMSKEDILSQLRLVMLSGDWIPVNLPDRIKKHFDKVSIVSLGGATEAAIWSIHYPIQRTKTNWKSIPYGIPLANQQFYVLNYNLEFCPLNVPGQLFIGGVGLAKEYRNDIQKTESAFIEHTTLGRLYSTGDYGVMRLEEKGAYIEFLGRKDQQVKIRGYRVELEEIEKCLEKNEFVTKAVVTDIQNEKGIKVICAYYISEEELELDELRIYLLRYLPEYMIPAYFIEVEEIPLTINGKVNKSALPGIAFDSVSTYAEPTNEIEEQLCGIWEESLSINKIGIDDNYFELGGDSLMAAVIIAKMQKKFGVSIPLKEVFASPMIRPIAQYIANNKYDRLNHDDTDLLLLRKGNSSNNNIFFIHAGSGEVEGYFELADNFPNQYNCWAVRAERFQSYAPKHFTIEFIANQYKNKIKEVQEHGSYHLGGWCLGGTIAFEIARQLEEEGENVLDVLLINSYAPERELFEDAEQINLSNEKKWLQKHINNIEFGINLELNRFDSIEDLWTAIMEEIFAKGLEEVINEKMKEMIPNNIASIVPDFRNTTIKKLIYYFNIIKSFSYARADYIPKNIVKASLIFVEALESGISNKEIWNLYCKYNYNYESVKANHTGILNKANILELSKKLYSYYS